VKRWILALPVVLLALSCGREAVRPVTPLPADDKPQEGGTLISRLDSDITSLNPVTGTTALDKRVSGFLFTPLIALDQSLRPIPGLADKWEVSTDGKVYTFHLDPHATHEDHTPVTAADVLFTMRKIVDPNTESPELAGMFEGIDWTKTKAIDDHTVSVAFQQARAAQIYAFNLSIVAEHAYSKGDFRTDWTSRAIGNGPYRLVRRVPGEEVLIERREDYWGKRPYLLRILFKVITDDQTAWSAAKRGDIDDTTMTSDIWKLEGENPAIQRLIDIHRFYYLNYNYIPWNLKDPVLSDKRIRMALAMSLDRRSIIANLFHGTARVMTGPFTPDQFGYNPAVPAIEYDPDGALKLFQATGWRDSDGDGILDKNGKPFKLEMLIAPGNGGSIPFVQVYQNQLKQIGVQLDVVPLDFSVMIQRIFKGQYQCAYLSWDLDPDPDLYPMFHSSQIPPRGSNFVFYSNPEVDKLIVNARGEMDESKRLEMFQRLHAILAEDQPYLWALQSSTKWAVNRRVKNVKESKGWGLFGWYPGPLEWWIPIEEQRIRGPQRGAATTTRK
jgi:peptide/nickel transport system substrate-binding protein